MILLTSKEAPGSKISSQVVPPYMKSFSKRLISLDLDLLLWLQRGVATDVDPVVVEGRVGQVCDIVRVV